MANKKNKTKRTQQICIEQTQKDMGWIKSLLNNVPLLKWVKKYSADKLLEDNDMAKTYNVETNEDSISITDATLTKLLVTHSRYAGEAHARYSMKQITEIIKLLGEEGELVIGSENNNEMFIQIGDTTVVLCPLSRSDTETYEEEIY